MIATATAAAAATPLTAPPRHRSAFSVGIAVVALAGVPAIWLPFAYGITPASVLFDDEWQLGWPYLLAIPIAMALVRWVASGRLSNAERWGGRVAAVGACCVTGWIYAGISFDGNLFPGSREALMGLLPLAILVGGEALTVWAMRSGRAPDGLDAIVMMEAAYLPNVVLCVLMAGSWDQRLQPGAYAAVLTSVAYVIHVVAVLSGRLAPRSR
jgi:hypothetical protein